MTSKASVTRKITTMLAAVLVCTLAFSLWVTLYHYDNKYTAGGPQAQNGWLTLDEQSIETDPVVFLVDGWEYYSDILLTPADFTDQAPVPSQYIFIGRFGGFERTNQTGSPHGSASYRLRIALPQETRTYALELPEIFSAYRLYVNGRLAVSMGEPDPANYRPQTGNRVVNIEAGGSVELLLAVSDYSHLYSGLVYPPAFGLAAAIEKLLQFRLFFRTSLCVAAFTVGLLAVLISLLSRKNTPALLYGLLCLLFVGYVSYPVTQTFFTGFQPKYAIENISFCAMLAVVLLLTQRICRIKTAWVHCVLAFGALLCLWSAAGPFLWRTGSLRLMLSYSFWISAYEWIVALFLTAAAIWGVWHDTVRTKPLLFGILLFDTALIADRLLPLHEPMVSGWFVELASFFLIAAVGVTVGQEVADRYKETAILMERTKNMEQLYKRQQTYYTMLKREIEESKRARHDLRHHFTVIDGFVQSRQYDKLTDYITQYQTVGFHGEAQEYCPIAVINVLSHHYATLAKEHQIAFDIRCSLEVAGNNADTVNMLDADLCSLYSNLMENAVEACLRMPPEQRYIRVAVVRPGPDRLLLRVWNNAGAGLCADGDSFFSSKEKGRRGYGLVSVRTIAEKHGGSAMFSWDEVNCEFDSKVMLSV